MDKNIFIIMDETDAGKGECFNRNRSKELKVCQTLAEVCAWLREHKNELPVKNVEVEEWTPDGTFLDSTSATALLGDADKSESQAITINTPKVQLIIETKDVDGDYPGVYVQLRTDKDTNMVACVEYIKSDDELCIENYSREYDAPTHIINWETGKDKL